MLSIKSTTDNISFNANMDVVATLDGEQVITDGASRNASKADISLLALETTTQAIKLKVDTQLDVKVSEAGGTSPQEIWEYNNRTITSGGGMTESELHISLDNYSNKDDYKSDATLAKQEEIIVNTTDIPTKVWSYKRTP